MFPDCNIEELVISKNISSISEKAFPGNPLTKVVIEGGTTNPLQLYDNAFEGCRIKEFDMGRNLTLDNCNLFYNESSASTLEKVHIGKDVTYINNHLFHGCSNLSSVTCDADSLTGIGEYAFYGCSSLEDISFMGQQKVLTTISKGLYLDT